MNCSLLLLLCFFLLYFLFVQDGYTALMKAVKYNRTDIVELLLKDGADINVKVGSCRCVVIEFICFHLVCPFQPCLLLLDPIMFHW